MLGAADQTILKRLPRHRQVAPALVRTTKVSDATPGMMARSCARSDLQPLLAKLRYNRLIDVFAG